jgi:hypothetical protein
MWRDGPELKKFVVVCFFQVNQLKAVQCAECAGFVGITAR